jgi:hypothetical protein
MCWWTVWISLGNLRYGSRTLVHDHWCEVDGLCRKGAPHVREMVDVEVPLATCVLIPEVE